MAIKKTLVTEPTLPDLKDFVKHLEQIWDSKWLTNNGCFHEELEEKLAQYLGVKHISLFSNGTLALITAIQALELTGEVITTPYSFVATAHSLWWNKIKPVFVDVDPVYGNLDPDKIEAAITEKTTAILPVHVYGHPCDHQKIKEIANRHGLKLIYDAAHAFGVKENDNSILNYGDLSILSFHATKVYNTIEGGAIISHSAEMKKHIDYLKNFGFEDEITVVEPGINAKMNEIQSAYGLLQLKNIDENIYKRKVIAEKYKDELRNVKGLRVLEDKINSAYNYSYFPIFIDEQEYGKTRDDVYFMLQEHQVYGRRYFYPLISHFHPYNQFESSASANLICAEKMTKEVICLPIYPNLDLEIVFKIIKLLKK